MQWYVDGGELKKEKNGEGSKKCCQILKTEDVNSIVTEEVRLIALEEIEIARQYFKQTDSCECLSQIEVLQKELAKTKEQVTALTSENKRLTFLRNA